MSSIISVQNLTKTFIVPHQKRTTLKENFVDFWRGQTYEKFAALSDVSFEVKRGEFFGIVGQNGCGKSTLLKILAGIYQPNQGTITFGARDMDSTIVGRSGTLANNKIETLRIAPLLELGIGFQQDLSARENIFINATLLGLPAKQIRHLLPQIVEFAEIGHFLDLKVKNFSSGMRQRLAFAIAAHLDADIYLCDEVLAVGDESFQNKCFNTFAKWREQGKTVILVSHDAAQIESLCDRAIYLDHGQLKSAGSASNVIADYHAALAQKNLAEGKATPSTSTENNPPENFDASNSPLRLLGLSLFNSAHQPIESLGTDETLLLHIHYLATKPIDKPVFGIAIHHIDGTHITGPNTKTSGFIIDQLPVGEGILKCRIDKLNLLAGQYLISLSAFDYTCQRPFDYLDKSFSFTVERNRDNQYGLVDLSVNWLLQTNDQTVQKNQTSR